MKKNDTCVLNFLQENGSTPAFVFGPLCSENLNEIKYIQLHSQVRSSLWQTALSREDSKGSR